MPETTDPPKPRRKRRRRRDYIAPGLAVAAILVGALSGWWRARQPVPPPLDEAAMRAEVERWVPLGTRIDTALSILGAHRFDCVSIPVAGSEQPQPAFCARVDPVPAALEWLIALKSDGRGNVSQIILKKAGR